MEKKKDSLAPELAAIAYHKATEPPFSGKYVHETREGTYHCAVCGEALFASAAKYDSGSGWPSFTAPVTARAVAEHPDHTHGMRRVEVVCGNCRAHLGHVFPDGPAPEGLRYCINSLSLQLDANC